MRNKVLASIFIFLFSCQSEVRRKTFIDNPDIIIGQIDNAIAEKDTYKYMGHLRYSTFHFSPNSFPVFDTNFIKSLVTAHFDTLSKKVTRISILSHKDETGGPAQTDDFYFDETNELVKLHVLTHDNEPQKYAEYYFANNSLIYQETKGIEISELKSYLVKVNGIYKEVTRELLKRNLIDQRQ